MELNKTLTKQYSNYLNKFIDNGIKGNPGPNLIVSSSRGATAK